MGTVAESQIPSWGCRSRALGRGAGASAARKPDYPVHRARLRPTETSRRPNRARCGLPCPSLNTPKPHHASDSRALRRQRRLPPSSPAAAPLTSSLRGAASGRRSAACVLPPRAARPGRLARPPRAPAEPMPDARAALARRPWRDLRTPPALSPAPNLVAPTLGRETLSGIALPPRLLPGPAGNPRSARLPTVLVADWASSAARPAPSHSRLVFAAVRRANTATARPRAGGSFPAEARTRGARARAAPIVAVSLGSGDGPWRRWRGRRGASPPRRPP